MSGIDPAKAAEVLAVALGVLYVLLAIRRSRWAWVLGGLSSAIYVALFARSQLPMQAALQVFFVVVSAYGWWRWSGAGTGRVPDVGVWPARHHVLAIAGVLALSLASARILGSETQAAWPFVDSGVTWGSLVGTWLEARMKLESWVYWIVIDSAIAFLSLAQGLYLTAGLYLLFAGLAVAGFLEWRRILRASAAPARA
jgi:nicotinamide mononucleotide transporter